MSEGLNTQSAGGVGSPGLRLQALGTLRLVGSAAGTVMGDHGHQRRRLALLAVLAASGERGRSRDQLLGLFWPDVSQSRARHSLEQLVYAIRTSLDAAVFTGSNPLRLNEQFITSDVGDFEGALARGETEKAVELYRGPFLEGFYLNDAPEFEQWMDAERSRIERTYTEALERIAKSAEVAGDFHAEARWRQKLIETDPVSSKHAAGLIRALMNAGDHTAALQYAERYEGVVERELGTSVGPAVAALVAQVRDRARGESIAVRGARPEPGSERGARAATLDASGDERIAPADPVVEPSEIHEPFSERSADDRARPAETANQNRDEPREPETAASGRTRRVAFYGIATVAAVVLLVSVLWLQSRNEKASPPLTPAPSVAVLPLTNLSGDPDDAALVDGLSEELIGVLAKIDRLRVVARTSAFVFRNSSLDIRNIADSLRVSHILEGGVQKVGQRLRVQVRLVDARDGSTRWSETYDRELKDVFLVQSEIATAVARELDLRLGGAAEAVRRGPTRNIAAYELYLRGNDPVLLRSDSGARLALEYFSRAVALDSTYAAGYAGMARMYLVLRQTDFPRISARETTELAKKAALRAVALDDSLAEAHAALGLVRMNSFDFAAAEAEFKRAVALAPGHSRIREWLGHLHYWKGRPADALAEATRAVENDPLSPSAHAEVARALCAIGQVEQGLARLKTIESVQPPLRRAVLIRALCHGASGDWTAAAGALRDTEGGVVRTLRGYALARAGKPDEAKVILTELMDRWRGSNEGAYLIGLVHVGLGNRDQAFYWLNRSVDDDLLYSQLAMPFLLDPLLGDPRFHQFRKRIGLQNR